MVSFYPGPSRVHSQIPEYFQDAYNSGVLSMNHRSPEFMELYRNTVALLHEKLNIPKSYKIFFTTSATENWEILAQSLTKKSSAHFYNGAFGDKWYKYANYLHPGCSKFEFGVNDSIDIRKLKIPAKTEMLCFTHNETANGTQIESGILSVARKKFANSLICVDVTSSMGGIELNFRLGDAWFASVQKCFGLPAGMGILVCSPALIERSGKIGEKGRYNSFNFIFQNSQKWQTPFTPNVSNIYLLNRVLKNSDNIKQIEQKLNSRYESWVEIFTQTKAFQFFVKNDEVRSRTVLAIEGAPKAIGEVKLLAKKEGFLLGSGYGELKESTFRIANFPALLDIEVNGLQKFFKNNYL